MSDVLVRSGIASWGEPSYIKKVFRPDPGYDSDAADVTPIKDSKDAKSSEELPCWGRSLSTGVLA